MPRVSVIIPTHNRLKLLKGSIASVKKQSFRDYEIIVVDDGSTDDTALFLKGIKDDRIKYHFQTNKGLSAARNKGIAESEGDLIAFLDDDDLWMPEKLEVQVKAFEQDLDLGMITCGWNYINAEGEYLHDQRPWLWWPDLDHNTWLFACPSFPSAIMVKREWLDVVGGFDLELSPLSDWDLFLRLYKAGCQMTWVKQILCSYRIHRKNMTRNVNLLQQEIKRILDRFFSSPSLNSEIKELKEQSYAKMYIRLAARAYSAELYESAKDNLSKAVAIYPINIEKDIKDFLKDVLGFALDPLVTEDPSIFVEKIFSNLPGELQFLSDYQRWALGFVAKQSLFLAHGEGNRYKVIRNLFRILRTQPVLTMDRGVWSVVFEVILGIKITKLLRNVYSSKGYSSKECG